MGLFFYAKTKDELMIISIGTPPKCSDVSGHNQGTRVVKHIPGHKADIVNFGRALYFTV